MGHDNAVLTMDQVGRLAGVEVIEYERTSRGLLVSSGAGIMMATMDEAPQLRWCFDVDEAPPEKLGALFQMAEWIASPIVVAGWFSFTDPAPLRAAILGCLRQKPFVYAGHISLDVPNESRSLAELLARLRAL